ncbi:MAG TPA: CBS domain-containing protein [Acidimicrobiales bacterium]|nr:CBS domain-containing protein [Acidimicrobiales bacterium]
MGQTIRDIMTPSPATLPADASVVEAARVMRDNDVGDVILVDGDQVCGIITDRDIAVRAVAEGGDPSQLRAGDVGTLDPTCITSDDTAEDALRLMRGQAIRRLPVVEGGRPVGIITLGDLSIEREPDSALADISAAPPNS